RIVPIPKCSNVQSCSDLRPISIIPVLSKMFEKSIYSQLSTHIFNNKIIYNNQYGFQPRNSTTHALLAITDTLYQNIANNHLSIIVGIGFAKAFDKTSREIVYQKLKWYNIHTPIIKSYLEERSQFVQINNDKSQLKYTTCGTPQGSSLSGLLFLIMINDLPLHVKN